MSTFCTLNGSPSAPDALSTLLFCGSCAQSCVSASGVTTNSLASFSLAPALNSLATTASVTLTQSLDSLAAPAFISESTAAFALAQSSAATTKSIASCPLGSLLVAITSNYHLAIFSPAKHPSTGEWLLVGNLLPLLMQSIGLRPWNLEYNRIETLDSARASLLESTALGWSEVWIDSATSKHAYAFLGIGSKEGTVTLWRFSNENLTAPSYQAKIKPQSGWCTKVAWSQWVSVGGIQYCYLLCGYDNGAVYHHTITFDPFTHTLNASSSTLLTPADNKTASVIKFYTTHTTPLIRAAIAKGATLHVWTAPTPTHPSTSTDFGAMHALRIPCTMPVGGITWSLAGDEMRVYTMDGRALVLAVLPEAPLAAGMGSAGSTPPPEEDATSASATAEGPASGAGVGVQVALLEDLTAQFYKEILGSAAASAAEEDADEAGAAAGTEDAAQSSGWQVRFYGAVSSPHGLVDCVLYTMSEYEGLEYRTERHNNCFVLLHWNVGAGSLGAEVEAGVMQRVRELVARDDLLYRVSPATLLWDIVAHASLHREAPAKAGTPPVPTPATTAPTVTIVHRVQAMLREFFLSQQDVVEVNLDGADKGNPHHVLHQVPRILFSNSRMNCLRLQNHLMLSMMNTMTPVKKTEAATFLLANYKILLRDYVSNTFKVMQLYLSDPRVSLSETDTLMLTLLSDWCLANSTLMSATLTAVAQIFATVKRHSAYADVHTICDEYLLKVRAAGSAAAAAESKEECLACRGAIVFMSPWKAVCANGHPWDRCAVSLLTAATPKTRSCLGCNRKSISPEALATGDETAADAMPVDGTVVESNLMKVLLESMAVCVYCGNQLRS